MAPLVARNDLRRGRSRRVKLGDAVVLWLGRQELRPLVVRPGQSFDNRFGLFRHESLVGKPFGSKVFSDRGKGWLLLLAASPELWAAALPLRTQIIQSLDRAVLTAELHVRPGQTVVESGTGCGAMSLSFLRALGTRGRLVTFEFNEARADAAREDFSKLGMQDRVEVVHRNVCLEGFLCDSVQSHGVDAVFLDLPRPQDALESALQVLKSNGRLGSYSPCIEQVMATCEGLRELGFHSIRTIEAREKVYEPSTLEFIKLEEAAARQREDAPRKARPPLPTMPKLCAKAIPNMRGHTAYLTFAYAPLLPQSDKL